MNLRFTLIVALIAGALVAFALTLRDTESRQVGSGAPTATPEPILSLDPLDVQEVGVVGPTGAYTLSRVAGGWEVDDEPADTRVDSLVTSLAEPTVLRVLPEDRNPNDYGFASPSLTVTLRTTAGDSHVLVVGDKAVAEERRYIRLGDDGEIVMVSNYDYEDLIDWLTNPPFAPTATPTEDLTPAATEEGAEETAIDVEEEGAAATDEAGGVVEDEEADADEAATPEPSSTVTSTMTASAGATPPLTPVAPTATP